MHVNKKSGNIYIMGKFDMKIFGTILALIVIAAGVHYVTTRNSEETVGASKTSQATSPSSNQKVTTPTSESVKNFMHKVTIETNKGKIQFETYDEDAPKTVENFITLAEKGYYNGVIFHRVIKGFMIQGGDPLCATEKKADTGVCGTGGPGYKFADELNPAAESYKTGYKKGVVAMANAGPHTNGSQFFIMLEDYPLPNSYTIFGKVVSGQNVVDEIGSVKTGTGDRPLDAVIMQKVLVSDRPSEN